VEQSDRAERGEDVAVIETWLARSFIVIIAGLMLFIGGAGASVWMEYYRRFKDTRDPAFNTNGWTAMIVTVALECILAAVTNVGQAFELVTEGWGAIVGIIGTLLLPILGYKSVQTISAKGSTTNTTGG
jgi:hypothetical protein